ncbi:ATP-binding protein [Haoranjiania flava]|uniref:DNA polymerase III subunit delta n=1 Tax=Haoranjiania flava TaxID=1856322 RepID=A0AAE3IMY3_9BACT|nr:DNA polymerase III subunit delta' [Haoranjiania flava]MCU7694938.1 hypothetical protein [Haoranjiania flava]
MRFSEVVGQQEVKNRLLDMVAQNRLSHALLFLGKEGSGALQLAIAFAQYITCEKIQQQSQPDAGASLFGDPEPAQAVSPEDACGVCAACIKSQQLIHPDIHFSFPVIPKKSGDKPLSSEYIKDFREFITNFPYGNVFDWLQSIGAENKQGNITAEECNDIIRKLSLKSFESEYKILIVWMPEYLRKEGNKLLKLIEEPPAKTLFILVAENEDQILPTILSRCQLIKIPALKTETISAALQQNGLEPQKALQLASLSEGNYRKAIELLNNADDDWEELLRNWLNVTLQNLPAKQIDWIEEVNKLGREKQKKFLHYFSHLLEQSLRLSVLGAANVLMPDNEKDFVLRLNKIASFGQQEVISKELDNAIYYIERNANAKMLFHALTIKLKYIIKNKTLILAE